MASPKKQVITTGNGTSLTPVLDNGNAPTEAKSQPSQTPTSIAPSSTKPVSLAEALSLLQTDYFDLRSMGCRVQLAAKGRRLYAILETPKADDLLSILDGHILLRDRPVVIGDTGKAKEGTE